MARISIDLIGRSAPSIRRIFGGFIEHLGRCIYGGIFDEGSPSERRARIPARRPGGRAAAQAAGASLAGRQLRQRLSLAGRHRAEDERPRRMELAWHGEESNRFGTDEFIAVLPR